MENKRARGIAEDWVERLRPVCTRIEIAGSIRRGKADVGDIEIVAIPDLTPVPRAKPEFGKPIPLLYTTQLDKLVSELVANDQIVLEANGSKQKKFWVGEFPASKKVIKVDLFLVTAPATWGVQMAIRTGPADFSHWFVTQKSHGGAMPRDHWSEGGAIWTHAPNGAPTVVGFDDEVDFLAFLGLGWIEPEERVAKWARR